MKPDAKNDIDSAVRSAFDTTPNTEDIEAIWDRVAAAQFSVPEARRNPSRVQGRRRLSHILALAALLLLSASVVAIANTASRTSVFGLLGLGEQPVDSDPIDPDSNADALAINETSSAMEDKIDPGTIDTSNGRMIQSSRRDQVVATLFAAPTDKERACLLLTVSISSTRPSSRSAGCTDSLTADSPVAFVGNFESGRRGVLAGVISGNVQDVQVQTNKGNEAATMSDKSFIWIASAPGTFPLGIVVLTPAGEQRLRYEPSPRQTEASTNN